MSRQSVWYYTNLPIEIVDIIERDLSQYGDNNLMKSEVIGSKVNITTRNSLNTWVNDNHWIVGFLWHYVMKANNENFLYDIKYMDSGSVQYTVYKEGMFYDRHTDVGFNQYYNPSTANNVGEKFVNENSEIVRKISFSLQLSDPDDYEGGNLVLLDDSQKKHIAPRKRGTMIFFDSRTSHRVNKVKKGTRKSLVGWVAGPRWR